MFEDMTYEGILERCLTRVSDSVDKREGAVIYDAIAPAAAELAILYSELGTVMDRAFPDTETGLDLTKKARERGVFRRDATRAVRRGYFEDADGNGCELAIGSRFSGGDVNFAVTEKIASGQYRLEAETAGSAGNAYFGTLFPIDFAEGLAAARLDDVLIPGEDEESDDALRARYYASLEYQAFGGNQADYKNKIEFLPGVGAVKILPTFSGGYFPSDLRPPDGAQAWINAISGAPADVLAWLKRAYAAISAGAVTVGAGTVRIVLVNSDWGIPSPDLIASVQAQVDPVERQGEGVGIAPIGHTVSVSGVAGKTIDLSFQLTFEDGVAWEDVQKDVRDAVQSYFYELIHTWADADGLVVRVSQIETKILNVPGVIDIAGTTINGATANISLSETEIPVLGVMTHGAV